MIDHRFGLSCGPWRGIAFKGWFCLFPYVFVVVVVLGGFDLLGYVLVRLVQVASGVEVLRRMYYSWSSNFYFHFPFEKKNEVYQTSTMD